VNRSGRGHRALAQRAIQPEPMNLGTPGAANSMAARRLETSGLRLKHNDGDREAFQVLLKGQVSINRDCDARVSNAPFLTVVQPI
jgi:hypothetical protein